MRTHRLEFTVAVTLAALTGACSGSGDPGTTPLPTDAPRLERTVFLPGLSAPWDIAFATDGTMFFTEKCRGLSVRHTNGSVTRLFGTTGSSVVASDLECVGQSGMHGVGLERAVL